MKNKIIYILKEYNIFIILLAVFIYAAVNVEYFILLKNITNWITTTSYYGIVAIGMTFVLLTGAVDLSMGMQVSITAMIGILALDWLGPIAALLAAILTGLVLGLLNGQIIIRMGINPLIATLATMTAFKGVALILSGGESVAAKNPALGIMYTSSLFGLIRYPIIICFICLLAAHIFLRRTRLGMSIYVVGGNVEAARMAGINVNRVKTAVYLLVGAFAGFGGFMLAARSNSSSILLVETLNLDVVSSCVIGGIRFSGGKGNVFKMIFGVALIQLIVNILSLKGVIGSTQTVITGLILVAILLLDRYTQGEQSQGIAR